MIWKWKKVFRRKTDFNYEKDSWGKNKNNPAYLQGFIIALLSDIEELQTENDQLRRQEGIWISKEEAEKFNVLVESLKLTWK